MRFLSETLVLFGCCILFSQIGFSLSFTFLESHDDWERLFEAKTEYFLEIGAPFLTISEVAIGDEMYLTFADPLKLVVGLPVCDLGAIGPCLLTLALLVFVLDHSDVFRLEQGVGKYLTLKSV